MNWSRKLTLWQRERDGGGGQPPVKSEVVPSESDDKLSCFPNVSSALVFYFFKFAKLIAVKLYLMIVLVSIYVITGEGKELFHIVIQSFT